MNKKLLIIAALLGVGYIAYKKGVFSKKSSDNGSEPGSPESAPSVTETNFVNTSSSESPQVTVVSTDKETIKVPTDMPDGAVVITDRANPFFTVN